MSNSGGSAGQTASAGSGGSASGGTAGTPSGSAGTAGSGSTGPTMGFAFASSIEEFRVSYYCEGPQAADPANCIQVMAAAPPPVADADGGATATPQPVSNNFVAAEFDGAVGDPDPGSMKITLQFSLDGQLADIARNFGSATTAGLNLTGKTITLQARVEPGGAPTVAGKIYVKTGAGYSYADAGETTLTAGSWTTLRYATPTYYANMAVYDIADVREIGIEILGRGATGVMPTVVHIDTLAY